MLNGQLCEQFERSGDTRLAPLTAPVETLHLLRALEIAPCTKGTSRVGQDQGMELDHTWIKERKYCELHTIAK